MLPYLGQPPAPSWKPIDYPRGFFRQFLLEIRI